MKPEDLKVGMIFKKEFFQEGKVNSYYYIFKLHKHSVFYYDFIDTEEAIFICGYLSKELFCNYFQRETSLYRIELIDKVPPKIVEVEEEVPVYIEDKYFQDLKNGFHIFKSVFIETGTTSVFLSEDKNCFNNPVELGKIKRTVKKELNWCWEEGCWK
jgi:hypothetical protein